MAIIYSYPKISLSDLNFQDRLILSRMNGEGNPTRSLSLQDLRSFINPSAGSGAVQGVGVTDYLPVWTDGPNSVIGDSIAKFEFGDTIRVEGKFQVEDEFEVDGEAFLNGGGSATQFSAGSLSAVDFYVQDEALIGSAGVGNPRKWEWKNGVIDILMDQWIFREYDGALNPTRMVLDSQLSMSCEIEMFNNDISEIRDLFVVYGQGRFSNNIEVDGSLFFATNSPAAPLIKASGFDLLFESNGTKYFTIDDAAGKIEFSETVSTVKGLEATGKNFMPNLDLFADDAAAGAGGMAAGQLYQTDGTGAAPLNIKGIVMLKQ